MNRIAILKILEWDTKRNRELRAKINDQVCPFQQYHFEKFKKNQRSSVLRNSSGQGLTEYLVLVILICVVSLAAAKHLGTEVKERLEYIKEQVHGLSAHGGRGRHFGGGDVE